jgi:multidrug efflux pump subunit AcrA (membrane-fusion protein)
MRKALLIVVVLAVVVLAVGVVGPRLLSRPTDEPEIAALGEASPYEGQERITGMGVVVPVRWARLSFPTSGQLAEIKVTTGMTVTAGQVLATLRRQELELQVQLAESELETQEAQLAQLKEGGSQAEIAAAQANYAAAVAAREELRAGPSDEEKALADADLQSAKRALQLAQAAYDAVSTLPDIGARPQALQLEQATIDYQRAQAAYELAIAGPSEAALKQAESQVAAAEAHLEALTSDQPSAIRAAEASVTRAEVALQQARLQLEQATLHAPFDGTITSVAEIQPGEMVSSGTTILTIADLTELQVEITDLDEWGAANTSLDQTVDVLVPALGNRNLRGRVTFVASEPTVHASGAVFYKALVALDNQDPALRWGNSVKVRLYVAGAHGVGFR